VLRILGTPLAPIAAGILRVAGPEWLALTPVSRGVGGAEATPDTGAGRGERGAITPPA